MKKRLILGASLASLLVFFLLIAGCGDGGEDAATQAESAAPAEEPAATEAATETAIETATEAAKDVVATHDCAGGCGMNDWPEDKMTEIDGKWYCAGCAKKVETGGEGHGDG